MSPILAPESRQFNETDDSDVTCLELVMDFEVEEVIVIAVLGVYFGKRICEVDRKQSFRVPFCFERVAYGS